MFKYPKSSLFILLLSANLLVPFHSDFIFGSLGSDYGLFETFVNALNPLSFALEKIFLLFGETGLGVVQVLVFFLLALFTFYVFNLEKSFPLSLILTLLCVGTFQYAQDLHPAQIFYLLLLTLIFVSKIELSPASEKVFWYLVFPISVFVFTLIDWRNIYWLLAGLSLIESEKRARFVKKIIPALCLLTLVLLTSSTFQSYLIDSAQRDLLEVYQYRINGLVYGSLGQGMNFDFAFLGILIGLFVIFYHNASNFLFCSLVALGLLCVSLYSYQFKVFLALWLAVIILREDQGSQSNAQVQSLKIAFGKFEHFVGRLSADGVVFLFLSVLFVSLVSFIKLPITEAMFPVLKIDKLVEENECPRVYNRQLIGYLKFRFKHLEDCRFELTASSLEEREQENFDLSIPNYDKFPDRWR